MTGIRQKRRTVRFLSTEALEHRQMLAVVVSAADNGPGTLRDALAGADPNISFDVAAMGTATITLTTDDLIVARDVVIDGDDGQGGRVTIDGGGAFRVLMDDGLGTNYANQTLANLIVSNGYAPTDGGGVQSFEHLTLNSVVISDSYSLNDGGGLAFGDETRVAGDLVITNSLITRNFAADDGGGIDFYNGRSVVISDSEISQNTIGRPTEANVAGGKLGGGARFIDGMGLHPGGQTFDLTNVNVFNNRVQGQLVDNQVLQGSGNGLSFDNLSQYLGGSSVPSTVRIIGGTISGNFDDFVDVNPNDSFLPDGAGGGIAFTGATDIVVDGTLFDGNYAFGNSSGVKVSGAVGQTGAALGDIIQATFNNITITNHGAGPRGGVVTLGGALGAIEYSDVDIDLELMVNDSTITGNTANFGGGIILRQGVDLTVNRSEINGNVAYGSGGAMYVINFTEDDEVRIHHSTVADNTATFNGAGILLRDNVPGGSEFQIDNSTLSGNFGEGSATYPAYGDGGGIFNSGMGMTIRQSTISTNRTANDGGGIFVENLPPGTSILQSTIFGNTANADDANGGSGGGIFVGIGTNNFDVNNSVVSSNQTPAGVDEIDDPQNRVSANNSYVGPGALLGPLQLNGGGTTETHAPLKGSPLIDMGDDNLAPFATDQNGNVRIRGTAVDIGSTESNFSPRCDFDFNGLCDIVDIDLLAVASGMGTNDPLFDLTTDGNVDRDDLQEWLIEAGARPENVALTGGNAFLEGDANLDGAVDGLDFIAWNDAKFSTEKLWSTGNFDGSPVTDGVDFLVWNDNKFQTSAPIAIRPNQLDWASISNTDHERIRGTRQPAFEWEVSDWRARDHS